MTLIKRNIILFFILFAFNLNSQSLNNLRFKQLNILSDTVKLDSLSIIPSSVSVFHNDSILDIKNYSLNYSQAILIINSKVYQKVSLKYRVYPFNFNDTYSHKSRENIFDSASNPANFERPFSYEASNSDESLFNYSQLNKSGSISRGVLLGNNQNLSLNSSLNLQLSGKISEDFNILASISDENIPIQPEGNTQQLQDFDLIFIQLFNDQYSFTVGDFWTYKPYGYFMNYQKRNTGILVEANVKKDENIAFKTSSSFAISKGKFARNVIQGIERNQGPYQLMGEDNKLFITVLSGTERVYIDGKLMKRGQNYDYIIDYNTAEVVFMPRQIITKDKRIIVEFQYSDKNYVRSIVQSANEFKHEKGKYYVNFYSEQDHKNQSLQQDLRDSDKVLLSEIGNDLSQAFVNRIDSIGYNNEQTLYRRTDSLGYEVYVNSTNPNEAFYELNFSYVGLGSGNYILDGFNSFGKVYKWIKPDTVNGEIIQNGDYAPVIILITPQRRQMLSLGSDFKSKNSKGNIEFAGSNTDLNTFSTLQNNQNLGYAIKTDLETKVWNKNSNDSTSFYTFSLFGEFRHQQFERIERYRSTEFERDWNIQNQSYSNHQLILDFNSSYQSQKIGKLDYHLATYSFLNEYEGYKNSLKYNINKEKIEANIISSYLISNADEKTNFYRHKGLVKLKNKSVYFAFFNEFENNKFKLSNDSLLSNSYAFNDWKVTVETPSENKNGAQLFYGERTDKGNNTNELSDASIAKYSGVKYWFNKSYKHKLSGNFTYRNLEVLDTNLINQEAENTVLNSLEYRGRWFNNFILYNNFYQVGSGLERQNEYAYIEVATRQGTYTWIDYNENNVRELNEFEIAQYQDQANYIRTFIPSNEFVSVNTLNFSQSINFNFRQITKEQYGVNKYLAKLTAISAYRINRKNNNEVYNPFSESTNNEEIISLSQSFLNTLFYNRGGRRFSTNYSYEIVNDKQLTSNGFDERNSLQHQFISRYIFKSIEVENTFVSGNRKNQSNYLSNRDYSYDIIDTRPIIMYQIQNKGSVGINYRWAEKYDNNLSEPFFVNIQSIGLEASYNQGGKGSIKANFNWIEIKYNNNAAASVEYELLEALNNGTNYTWSISWGQNINSFLQLDISYNGRKSEGNNAIHNANAQIRAFF